jgi:Ca2+-binding EF-hand superfamily protein
MASCLFKLPDDTRTQTDPARRPFTIDEQRLLKLQLAVFFDRACNSALPVLFSLIDRDSTGFLTLGNLYAYIASFPAAEDWTERQIEAMAAENFEVGDVDKDGVISFQEFVDMMKTSRTMRRT